MLSVHAHEGYGILCVFAVYKLLILQIEHSRLYIS